MKRMRGFSLGAVKDFSSIFDEVEKQFSDIQNWRRHLHKYPELSFEEKNTARFIEEKLRSFGLPVKTQIGGHGIVAELEGKEPGKTIALRADFDALPFMKRMIRHMLLSIQVLCMLADMMAIQQHFLARLSCLINIRIT